MKSKGISLIELVVVISVLSLLLVVTGFSFMGWKGKYSVESTTKDIYTDLMNARTRAMTRSRTHFIDFPTADSYTIYDDDSDSVDKVPDGDGILQRGTGITADTTLPTFPKTVEYDLSWNNAVIEPPLDLTFNTKGLATTFGTISVFVDRDGNGTRDFVPDYDCIVVSATRINIGQLDDNETVDRADDDCIAK